MTLERLLESCLGSLKIFAAFRSSIYFDMYHSLINIHKICLVLVFPKCDLPCCAVNITGDTKNFVQILIYYIKPQLSNSEQNSPVLVTAQKNVDQSLEIL